MPFREVHEEPRNQDTPIIMINADQNWNQPLSVPANRKTFAITAAPSQNIKSPTL